MIATRKHQPSATRKLQIMAAAELVLMEAGIDAFTIDQVALKAGVAKGTIYKYYKNKDALFMELCVKGLSILLQKFKEHTAPHAHALDKLQNLCMGCYAFYQEYPEFFKLLSYIERPGFDMNLQEYRRISFDIQAFVEDLIEKGQQNGQINPNLPKHLLDYTLWSASLGVIQFIEAKKKLLRTDSEVTVEVMMDTFSKVITRGMGV